MLRRDEYPTDSWQYRYQIGFFLFEFRGYPLIIWRSVPQRKFLDYYYNWVTLRSRAEDILALFHAGDVQRYRRQVFRALPV